MGNTGTMENTDPGQDRPRDEQSGAERQDRAVTAGSVAPVGADGREEENTPPHTVIEEPAKVMRIGEMIKRLLDEVRSAPLDEAARVRLAEIHERSLEELEDGLSEDLVAELHRISLPFSDDAVPSDAELRIAQAQLVGWLEGLFHGLQTALVAQQMAAQAQLRQGHGPVRALPPGLLPGKQDGGGTPDARPTPGQYL